jgi:hypothetical protein
MKLPRNAQIWGPGFLRGAARSLPSHATVWLAICDHYEPLWRRPDAGTARGRVANWRRTWPEIASRHADSEGRPPQYSFFYPEEEYAPEYLDPLAEMEQQGVGSIEAHLHHDGESEAAFVERLGGFVELLHRRHGAFRRAGGKVTFGFIHGNWALDNSRHDGRYCGLNNEITLLRDLGCYADFTLPSAPSTAQTRTVNSIYWAKDDPARPKSHDRGIPVAPGGGVDGDLMIIQGPLGLRWLRHGRMVPRLDRGELAVYDPPTRERIRLWLRMAPRIGGHIFIKLFTHGAQEGNMRALLDGGLDALFQWFREECGRRGYVFRYATARQMWEAIESIRRSGDAARP